ncbi:MAG: aldo/keto reductase [bacterium]
MSFDHADIYGRGKCEELFSGFWKQVPRDQIILQTKCGIRPRDTPEAGEPGRYDFSNIKDIVLHSWEGAGIS